MKRNHQGSIALVVAAFIGTFGAAAITYGLTQQESAPRPNEQNYGWVESAPEKTENILDYSEPVSISIPDIGVDSGVIRIGKAADGTIDAPAGSNIDKAAWYENSPTPGQFGSSIIQAHLDKPNGQPSLFFNLAKLQPGDEISVVRKDGKEVTYAVTGVRLYDKDEFPKQMIFGLNESVGLRLITCGGALNSTGEYDSNTVVFATLAE